MKRVRPNGPALSQTPLWPNIWFGGITRMKTRATFDGVARTFWHYFCRKFGFTTLVGLPILLVLLVLVLANGTATSALTLELLTASGLGMLAAFGFLRIFPAWYLRKLAEPDARPNAE